MVRAWESSASRWDTPGSASAQGRWGWGWGARAAAWGRLQPRTYVSLIISQGFVLPGCKLTPGLMCPLHLQRRTRAVHRASPASKSQLQGSTHSRGFIPVSRAQALSENPGVDERSLGGTLLADTCSKVTPSCRDPKACPLLQVSQGMMVLKAGEYQTAAHGQREWCWYALGAVLGCLGGSYTRAGRQRPGLL